MPGQELYPKASSRRAESFGGWGGGGGRRGESTRGPEREPRRWVPAPNVTLVDRPISRIEARVRDTSINKITQRA